MSAIQVLDCKGRELEVGSRAEAVGCHGRPVIERIGGPNRVDQLPIHMLARDGTTSTRWVVWGDAGRPSGTYIAMDLELIDPPTDKGGK